MTASSTPDNTVTLAVEDETRTHPRDAPPSWEHLRDDVEEVLLSEVPQETFTFEWDGAVEGWGDDSRSNGGEILSQNSSPPSTITDTTLQTGRREPPFGASCGRRADDSEQPRPQLAARAPPQATRRGPPFAVGDLVVCEAGPHKALTRAVITEADHPWYDLHLDGGNRSRVSSQDTFITLNTKAPPDCPDFDSSPEIKAVRQDLEQQGRIGSYGVHNDAHHLSLHRLREEKDYSKAVKADDAAVPVHLWNDRVTLPGFSSDKRDRVLDKLRALCHRRFLKNLEQDYEAYMTKFHGPNWTAEPMKNSDGFWTLAALDQRAAKQVMWHSEHTTWFEYKRGSRLIHFRFPPRYRTLARDGVPIFFETDGPTQMEAQPPIPDPDIRAKVREKVQKVLRRGYMLTEGTEIKSLIRYFAVPKGDDDVRIVYDGTANGLNASVWVPSFWLPSLDSLVRSLDAFSWMTDRDVADMFLNYQLHASAKPYTGIDLGPLRLEEKEGGNTGPRWAFWDRCLMGFSASPYNAIKMALVVEEVVLGNRHETRRGSDGKELNPFQWDRVRLNLPGTPDYDPRLSWISKLRKDGLLACGLFTFVDDERITAPTRELAWQASHRLASIQSYLGVQDAARKVRPCSKSPGAWAGVVAHTFENLGVCSLTSVEKWGRMKEILRKWSSRLAEGDEELSHKELLSDRGFLVYVTRVYPAMVPYLKGFHLTIEMWRGGRDADGYKLPPRDDSSVGSDTSLSSLDDTRAMSHIPDESRGSFDAVVGGEDGGALAHQLRTHGLHTGEAVEATDAGFKAPPSGTTPVAPRLHDDIAALQRLSGPELPPHRVIRPSRIVHVFYGFGDASGRQFGSTIASAADCRRSFSTDRTSTLGVRYRVGVWEADSQQESSNYRELRNLVEVTETEALAGRLSNCEFFLFTNNSTSESCFYRGSSSSKLLHDLVLRLRLLEMRYGMTIHVIHVSGRRMIAQGTDGCSRGSLLGGVMAGANMLDFIDLGRPAHERHPPLLDWIRDWTSLPTLKPLTPEGWFERGHGITGGSVDSRGVWIPNHCKPRKAFLWLPPPAVADAALEELLKSRHKREDLFHVFACPQLMLPRWRRLFNKAFDFTFEVPISSPLWPDTMFEPLWIGIALPFHRHRPWCLRRAPALVGFGVDLRRMLASGEGNPSDLLRKLWNLPGRISTLPECVARGVLHMAGQGPVPRTSNRG